MAEEKKSIERVHLRMDHLDDKFNDIVQRLSGVEMSKSYQDKTIDRSEARHYSFIVRMLPYIGMILVGGAIAMVFFKNFVTK